MITEKIIADIVQYHIMTSNVLFYSMTCFSDSILLNIMEEIVSFFLCWKLTMGTTDLFHYWTVVNFWQTYIMISLHVSIKHWWQSVKNLKAFDLLEWYYLLSLYYNSDYHLGKMVL